jgi:hypothetical protein
VLLTLVSVTTPRHRRFGEEIDVMIAIQILQTYDTQWGLAIMGVRSWKSGIWFWNYNYIQLTGPSWPCFKQNGFKHTSKVAEKLRVYGPRWWVITMATPCLFVCLFPWASAASHGYTAACWLIVPPALDVPTLATRCPRASRRVPHSSGGGCNLWTGIRTDNFA